MIASIITYFALLIAIAIYSRNRSICSSHNQALDYFLGGRKLGIVPLAMTTAATYISASSFIGGPSLAYTRGLVWVYLATVQYPVNLLIMGVIGKQVQILGQQHGLYDLADYIQLRYGCRLYTKFCATIIAIVLLLGLMVGIMGGARLLQGALFAWGLSYYQALLWFSLALAIYTLLGGFKAVVLTDILQGSLMLVACLVLVWILWHKAGGSTGLASFAASNPALFRADGGGIQPLSYTLNFTVLVGLGMVVQPISFSRLLALEPGKSLRKAIIIATVMVGLLTFLPHFIGLLGRIVLPNIEQSDQLMGHISQLFGKPEYGLMGNIFSGMLISAMLAAIMSSADSVVNVLGMTIYRHLLPRRLSYQTQQQGPKPSKTSHAQQEGQAVNQAEARHFQLSRILAALAILLMALLALKPPQLLVSLNLYALGATQVSLLWPLVLGLYYSQLPNVYCACGSSIVGLGSYTLLNQLYPNFGGVALLPYCLLLGIVAYFGAYYLQRLIKKRL